MTTFLKIVLAASLLACLGSLTEAGSAIAWGILKPVGAVLFIVFLIGQLLHKEVVKYDQECSTGTPKTKPASTSGPEPLRLAPGQTPQHSSL